MYEAAGLILISLVCFVGLQVRGDSVSNVPLLWLTCGFVGVLVVPGVAIVSLFPNAGDEGFTGALTRAFVVSFTLIAALTAIAMNLHLNATIVGDVLFGGSVIACLVAVALGRVPYLTTALAESWSRQSRVERAVAIGFVLCALAAIAILAIWGFPSEMAPEEVVPTRKLAELNVLGTDYVLHRLGTEPTYVYPAFSFAAALIARASGGDVEYVLSHLTALTLVLGLLATAAFVGEVAGPRARWLSLSAVLAIIFVDPMAFTHEFGVFLPLANRYGFAPGVLVPAVLYLLFRALGGRDRPAAFLVPAGVAATALVHAREALDVLMVVSGTCVALFVGGHRERSKLALCAVLGVASLGVLSIYQFHQSAAASHVAAVTQSLRHELFAYERGLVRSPVDALFGTVPKTIPSVVGEWQLENFTDMISRFSRFATRTWFPLGILLAAAFLGRWTPWAVRGVAWTLVGTVLAIRIPIVIGALAGGVGNPDIGQVWALDALLAITLLAWLGAALGDWVLRKSGSLPINVFTIRMHAGHRTWLWSGVRQSSAGALAVSLVLVAAWLTVTGIQRVWLSWHGLAIVKPDLLAIGVLSIALCSVAGWVAGRLARSDASQPRNWVVIAAIVAVTLVVAVGTFRITMDAAGVLEANTLTAADLFLAALVPVLFQGIAFCIAAAVNPTSERAPATRTRAAAPALAFVPFVLGTAFTFVVLPPIPGEPSPSRGPALLPLVTGANAWHPVRTNPEYFYTDIQVGRHTQLSAPVVAYLRRLSTPTTFYAPRDVISNIPIVSNHYVVYFGEQVLSTDIEYYQTFAPNGQDLLFSGDPTPERLALFARLVSEYQVAQILVTPVHQEVANRWLGQPALERARVSLTPVLQEHGYTIYQVSPSAPVAATWVR